MKNIIKKMLYVFALGYGSLALGAGSSVPLMKANNDLTDQASLQRGAKLYMNYCLGCHQLQYQRYERTFDDIGIPHQLGEDNLIFNGAPKGTHITNAFSDSQAEKWFNTVIPDLTLITRVKGGPDYVYTYLKSFYRDDSKPFGVDNLIFPSVTMPHVLEELQGVPFKEYETRLIDGQEQTLYTGNIKTDGSGSLSAEEYDQVARDLANFLAYVGEPHKLESEALGKKVLIFLFVLLILSILLKKEYWRDVH